jgi:uncharacterized GH25 family protein
MLETLRSVAITAALLCIASPAAAHDFWLQPARFWTAAQAQTSITLQVGHGATRQRSQIPQRRIIRFEVIVPSGTSTDLRGALHLGAESDDASMMLQAPGAHVIVLQTDNRAQSRLPAVRFNEYLAAEGLTSALAERRRTGRTDAEGTERYSRLAKAIVQVGAPGADAQGQATARIGLPLEIVLEQSPYAAPRATTLPVRVYFEGSPLAGALVKLTDLDNDSEPLEVRRADAQGRALFIMPGGGRWLLNVVWTKPLPDSDEMDFETFFSSLSFGFP